MTATDQRPAGATAGAGTAVSPAPAATASALPAVEAAGQSAGGQAPYVTVVLPCHNEEGHVVAEVARICEALDASDFDYELVAYDDASTDETLDRLREAQARYPRLRVVGFRRNGGSGTVRRIGTQQARGQVVVWTDADMSYPNERIPELVAMLAADPGIDQVVGARTSEEGTYKLLRVPAKWFIRKLAERLTGEQIPDLNSGLRVMRRDVAWPYLRLLPPGFSCVTTITIAFLSNQHDVRYVPIEYAKRAGRSKFHFAKDAYRYILQVLRMVMYFNPLKVLMPIALVLLGLGAAKAVYDIVVHPLHVADDTVLIFVSGLIIATLALLADLIVRSRSDVAARPSQPGISREQLLLESGADRRDALGVEAKPVHPARVARVLDLQAAVHDHRDATVLGDPRALGVDHAELAPEGAGVDRHRIPRDARQGLRRAEDVHDVHRPGHVEQARVARLPEDLALAGIDGDHPVAMPLEVVANEVAGAQLVSGQAHDRDCPGGVQHALDHQRVLVPGEIGHAVVTSFLRSRPPGRNPAPDPRSGPRPTRCRPTAAPFPARRRPPAVPRRPAGGA